MLSTSSTLRKRHGASLGLVAVLALVLALVGGAFFVLSLIFGGSREVRNAVDAGALNVGKKSLTLTVKSQGGDEDQFDDVTDINNEFGLANINRVWGKALWAGINASAIDSNGKDDGAVAHARKMRNAAESISNRLADKLKKPANLYNFFDALAKPNSARMLGTSTKVQSLHNAADWQTSLIDRTAESNIAVEMGHMPDGFTESGNIQPAVAKDGKDYLAGYQNISVLGGSYWFVPFKLGERPRLEAGNHFVKHQVANEPIAWANPLPNTFSVEGKTFLQNKFEQQAVSWVKTNPQVIYLHQIPHGFIRIVLKKNTSDWQLVSLPPNSQSTSYRFTPADVQVWSTPVTCGTGIATVSLGQEYAGGIQLGNVLFVPLTLAKTAKLRNYLTQRIQEIDPTFTSAKLMDLLNSVVVNPMPVDQEFFIFWDDSAKQMTVANKMTVPAKAPWLKMNEPTDGNAQTTTNKLLPSPNFVVSWIVTGSGACTGTSVVSEKEKFDWRACSGWNGLLGELTVHRTTDITLAGACSCFP